ncbi:MAG: hypothetical protein CMB72_02925 [Euryarchaeota archaeon]|nr:hypothetical protein [Euryarchaeota archaeon]
MAGRRASIRATLSILILLLASFTPIAFEYEEMSELKSLDYRYDSSTSDRKAWEWVTGGGSSYPDQVSDMIVLPSGEIYVTGYFQDSISIGSCNGNMAPNSNSVWYSIFIAKFDLNGSCDWINTVSGLHNVPTNDANNMISITTDSNHDVYMVSKVGQGGTYYFGSLSKGLSYGFISKINNNGTWEWASEHVMTQATELSISLDSNGNIWTAFSDHIRKYNSTGHYQTEIDHGCTSCMTIQNIFFDNSDNLYVNGYFSGSLSLTINGTSENYYTPANRLFIMKINSTSNYDWFSTAAYPTSSSIINSAIIDSNDDILVTGEFYGYLELGSTSLSAGGNQKGFVAKLNSTGDWLWGLKIDSSSTTHGNDLVSDNNGGVIVTGKYGGTLTVGPVYLAPSGGGEDVFVIKINDLGTPEWGLSGGSIGDDLGFRIGSDMFGQLYVSGQTDGSAIFGTNSMPSFGNEDIFLGKLSSDYDGDGETDAKDNDDDDDFILDIIDGCKFSPIGFQSVGSFDHDGDGCRDSDEDSDDDGDGVEDYADSCEKGMVGWIANSTTDIDQDGCMDSLEDMDDDADGFEDYDDLCPRIAGNSTYNLEKGCLDSDGDTRPDIRDPFPHDNQEWNDQDLDGVGDNADAFDLDPTQNSDRDGDGHGDNPFGSEGDQFPDDPTRWKDSDKDGVADEDDAFPNEESQYSDGDGDGFGDNPFGDRGDEFPDDPNEWEDSDRDGVGNNADDFPFDPSQQVDSDGDGFGDNPTGSGADKFPNDSSQWSDIDGDGYGDNQTGSNPDQFPTDPTQHSDRDGDGWGDNLGGRLADLFPDNPTQWEDADGDGLGDNQSGTEPDLHLFDFDNDGFIDAIDILPKFASPGDLDADGCMDEGLNPDLFPEDPTECFDFDGDGLGDNEDTDDDGDGWSDAVEDREGTDSRDALSMPVEPFEIVVPGTTVGLGAWDLIGMMGGIPLFIWIAFGFITRNNRTARFEERLRNATSRDELEEIALDSEYALMLRLIGPHQGIRLERLRVELDDMFEARKQQLSSMEPMPENQTHLVEEDMQNEVKSREL